jgi:hypothetical protein
MCLHAAPHSRGGFRKTDYISGVSRRILLLQVPVCAACAAGTNPQSLISQSLIG